MAVLETFTGTLHPVFVFQNTKTLSKTQKLPEQSFWRNLELKIPPQSDPESPSELSDEKFHI